LGVDWSRVDQAVMAYEGFRYGSDGEPRAGYDEIRRLTVELRRAR
jgi:hypothetical protein